MLTESVVPQNSKKFHINLKNGNIIGHESFAKCKNRYILSIFEVFKIGGRYEYRLLFSLSVTVLWSQLLRDESFQTFQILAVQLNVVMPSTFYPKRFNGFGTTFIKGQTMGEINHFIFSSMNDQHW